MKAMVVKNTRSLFLLCLGLAVNTCLSAQSTPGKFLLSAHHDTKVSAIDEQLRYLDDKPYRLSPLQKLELRTQSNQLDPNRQGYAVRINPANPWEMRSNNQYFQEYRSLLEVKKDLALEEALNYRYTLMIDWQYQQELRTLKEKGNGLIESYLGVLEKQQYSDFFDADDYVKLKLEQIDLSVELEEVIFEADDLLRRIKDLDPASGDPAAWSDQHTVPVNRLVMIADSLWQGHALPLTLTYYDRRINLAQREYSLERSNISVGFLQAQYQEYRIDQGRKPWSLSMGVTIPIVNPNKGDMTKRKMDVIEKEQEKVEAAAALGSASTRLREQLKSQVTRYNGVQEKISALKASPLSSTLNALQGNNPTVQIRLASNILKLETIALKLKQSILHTYIGFLGTMDVLQKPPLVNYLSEHLEVLENN